MKMLDDYALLVFEGIGEGEYPTPELLDKGVQLASEIAGRVCAKIGHYEGPMTFDLTKTLGRERGCLRCGAKGST